MADFEFLHEDLQEDVDTPLLPEGDWPDGLGGTLYAVGGTGSRVGDAWLHGFDAHGRVTAADLGARHLKARMVQTPLLAQERAAGRITRRRLFTNKPGRWSNLFDLNLANNAWHNVLRWGDGLVVANDPGFFVLDPKTLHTRGDFPLRPARGATFLPMPRRDPKTGHHVLVEVRAGLKDTLVVRELDDAWGVVREQSYAMDRGAAFYHDVTMTDRYYVVVQWSALSVPRLLWGAATVGECVGFDPASTPRIVLLPRDGGAPRPYPVPEGRLHFHFWNAWEEGDAVVLDVCSNDGYVQFGYLLPPQERARRGFEALPTPAAPPVRYTITEAGVTGRALDDALAEAPEIRADRRGQPQRYGWAPTRTSAGDEPDAGAYVWFHGLARHDFQDGTTQVWDAGARVFLSPAAFVPRGEAEDDGWVLTWFQEPGNGRSGVLAFDGQDVARGPVGRLVADARVGFVSHVCFGATP